MSFAVANNPPAINPRFIQGFYSDFTPAELEAIQAGLARVPGNDGGVLWLKFERNEAVTFFGRNAAGAIAFFAFYELKVTTDGKLEFFVGASARLQEGGQNLTATSFPQFEFFARQLGCDSVCFKTPLAGLVRKVQALKRGWVLLPILAGGEFVMRKALL